MAVAETCGWCSKPLTRTARTTRKKFCDATCRDTYWNATKSGNTKRGEWRKRRFGEITSLPTTPEQWAYIAGFFDGEGHVGVLREVRKANKSGFRYKAVVEASNTVSAVLEQIQAYLGGCGYIAYHATPSRKRFPNSKPCYRLCFSATEIRAILPHLYPWFVVKRAVSEVVFEFLKRIDELPMRASRDHEALDELWLKAKALNKRGI